MNGSERLPRAYRLARPAEIRRCLERGQRRRTEFLEMIWTENRVGHPRMGLVVPRFQASAVARNRLRRRLKEIWRRRLLRRQPAWDLIIRAHRHAYRAGFSELEAILVQWCTAHCGSGNGPTRSERQ